MILAYFGLGGALLASLAVSEFRLRRLRHRLAAQTAAIAGGNIAASSVAASAVQESRRLANEVRGDSQALSGELVNVLGSVMSIRKESSRLSGAGVNLAGELASAASAVEQLTASASSLADLAVRQSAVVSQAAAAIEQMSASAAAIAGAVEGRTAANQRLSARAREGVETARQVASVIEEFAQRSIMVTDMVHAINDIATSTNLLAMNAAIEAAHAGQYGRGFSVVASEIRKLAATTSEKAAEIERILSSIQDSITAAQQAGTRNARSLGDIAAIVEESVSSFAGMAEGIAELSGSASEIVSAIEQTRAVTIEIKQSSSDIAAATSSLQSGIHGSEANAAASGRSLADLDANVVALNVGLLKASSLNSGSFKRCDAIIGCLAPLSAGAGAGATAYRYGLLDVAAAKLHHKEWVAKVLLHRQGALKLDAAVVSDSHRCLLGTWLYRDGGLEQVRGLVDTDALEHDHDALHLTAAKLIANVGQSDGAALGELEVLSERIVGCLSRIEASTSAAQATS
ncbi:MAG: hypothetical protein A2087_00090 [Spirochaetes bacterium GWD1_61_31]|nr:MAG: hypothetical protein A2Y37_06765 [Spirochaetes bacterium GWB1_60_80]OHD30777.1 MAG: hypothetical protein A2004_04290 [Spirochaetes bacterium GWC1_61_12]OHD42946.1 MAG: hypothetical protein A2087_00090 [Spirochaetes bacterium GWD1_61_31]OHD46276.1 MAG: hypothetical protein A2Y35_07040 [Spirochaetes bacterium GWE1_60_18]OHD60883.1 MAG: hypothetical protein A2Y32_11785 [Spirochaetes bacterium GWF1_60_12]HAP42860.1 hypothetical protein [Spirochaetaceae bacterium]